MSRLGGASSKQKTTKGPRPMTKTEDIAFNISFDFIKAEHRELDLNENPLYNALHEFITSLHSQQPEIDFPASTVYHRKDDMYHYEDRSSAFIRHTEKELSHVVDHIEIDATFDEPVLVHSHIMDAEKAMQRVTDRMKLSDYRILPKGLLRDQRDKELKEKEIDHTRGGQIFM